MTASTPYQPLSMAPPAISGYGAGAAPFGAQHVAPWGILGGLQGSVGSNALGLGSGVLLPFSAQQAVAHQQLQQAAIANEIARAATQQQLQPFGHLGSMIG